MREVSLTAIGLLFFTNVALAEEAPQMPSFSKTPVTEEYLRELDNDQLRLLRRAIKGCPKAPMRSERDPCVTSMTDRAVADSGNADLEAFHQALRVTDRYDENRSSIVWRAWLQKR